jgi:hypothetical protein
VAARLSDAAEARGALDPAALAEPTRPWIAPLAGRVWSPDFYLAGSAALAVRIAHRRVRDLDLMSGTCRLLPADRRDLLGDLLALEPATRVETARDGYLFVRLPGGTALRFFSYPYPLVDPLEEVAGLAVASWTDLGLMKLGAIISRGTRRDFVDLYLIARQVPLDELFARSDEKFGHVGDFPLQAYKALADFSEAEDEPMPALAEPLEWSAVRSWAETAAARAGRATLAR